MRNKFEKLIEELKSNKYITLEKATIGEPLGENIALFDMILKQANVKRIPALMKEFYTEVGDIDIKWKYKLADSKITKFENEQAEELSGEIRFRPFEELLIENKDLTKAYKNQFLEEDADDLPLFRAIDYEDSTVYGLMQDGNKISDYFLFFSPESDGFLDAGLSLEQYFDAIFKFKGFNGWQYNITEDDLERMDYYIKELFK